MALGACADAAAPGLTVRDSAGVRVAENHTPAWTSDRAWRVGPPILDLGGPDAGGDEAFRGVATAVLTPRGLVVAEERGRVGFFDRSGGHVRTVGGPGDGPGEFRLVAGGGVTGDSIWLYDYFHRRLTFFTLRGELAGVRRLEGEDPGLLPVGRLEDGFLLARSSDPAGVRRFGLRRDTVPYLWFGADGSGRTELARLPAREYVVGEEDGRLTMASPPFVRGARHDARGSTWVHGDQERREIRVLSADGALIMVVRWSGPDLRITGPMLDAEIEDRVARHGGDRQGLRRFLTELPHPDTRPAHGRLHLGPNGNVWVETAASAVATSGEGRAGKLDGWQVFDPDGRWLGTVPAPGRFRITQLLEDRVVGVWLDPLDVEHVQVRPILRP